MTLTLTSKCPTSMLDKSASSIFNVTVASVTLVVCPSMKPKEVSVRLTKTVPLENIAIKSKNALLS